MELVEGSTYTNSHNLGQDFIETLEDAYRGQSRDRFLYGEWAAYEGLIYSDFSEETHLIDPVTLYDHVTTLLMQGVVPTMVEAYDFGLAKPSCYMLGIKDRYKNIFILDGFYKPTNTFSIEEQQSAIWEIRHKWHLDEDNTVNADPATGKKTLVAKNTGSKSIAQLFNEGRNPVRFRNADNAILAGIIKVQQYLSVADIHRHPITGVIGAPHLYINSDLTWFTSEATSYYWKTDKDGTRIDDPVDKDDHAMDTVKYLLSKEPLIADRLRKVKKATYLHSWSESNEDNSSVKAHRYG